MTTRHLKLAASALALAAAWQAAPAFAQTAPVAGPAAASLDELVVTARRREERLVDVPISVSAFTAETLQDKNIVDLKGLAKFSPGFTFNNASTTGDSRQQNVLFMRGMNSLNGSAATLFVDGAPFPTGALEGFSEVERVEVLKGPQSAYFGRSTFSGAVSVTTRNPSLTDYKAKISGDLSSYNTADGVISVEGPIIRDQLAIRLTGHYFTTDGQYKNNYLGVGRLGARETKSLSGVVYWEPSDRLSVKSSTTYFEYDDGLPSMYAIKPDQFNCRAYAPSVLPNWVCGIAPQPITSRIGSDSTYDATYQQLLGGQGPLFGKSWLDHVGLGRKVFQQTLNLNYDVSDDITASVIAAYHHDKFIVISDQDHYGSSGIPNPFAFPGSGARDYQNWLLRVDSDNEDSYLEGRLASSGDGRLQWMAGASLFKFDTATGVFGDTPYGFLVFGASGVNDVKTTGVFGSVSYKVTDALTASFDARYQWDDIAQSTAAAGTLEFQKTFKSFQPRAILKYQVTPDVNVYVSGSRGTRPGGFNYGQFAALSPEALAAVKAASGADDAYEEEVVTMYELGSKGSLLDRRLQYTIAIYDGLWKDQQLESVVNIPVTPFVVSPMINIGKTRLRGLEVEGRFRPTDRITLDGGFAYTRAKILQYECTECLQVTGDTDVTGAQLRRTPKYTGSLSAEYRAPFFASAREWYVRSEYNYRGSISPTEDGLAKSGATSIVNLRAGLSNETSNLEVYATNIFDNKRYSDLFRNGDLLALTNGASYSNNSILGTLALKPTFGVRYSQTF